MESDGISAHYGAGIVWPASEIQQQNQTFRTDADFSRLYMPFDHLLFFGADGGGDQFAFAIHADGQIHKNDIFRWKMSRMNGFGRQIVYRCFLNGRLSNQKVDYVALIASIHDYENIIHVRHIEAAHR